MSKVLILLMAVITLLVAAPTQTASAQESAKVYIVAAETGLNVRNKDCKVIDTVQYNKQVYPENASGKQPVNITCNLNNDYIVEMILVSYKAMSRDTGYVAKEFLSPVQGTLKVSEKIKANSADGLNIRDRNCKKVAAVPNNTILENITRTDDFIVCKVRNNYYQMQPIARNGKSFFVSSSFVGEVK